jgi:D-alanine-D-alanine ligase
LKIAIVHSKQSACTCHLSVLEACRVFGHETELLESEQFPMQLPVSDMLFDTCSGYRGYADWRWYPRACAEEQGIKVVGSQTSVLRVCDNKALGRLVLQSAGITVPRGMLVPGLESIDALEARIRTQGLYFPLVVKPVSEQGSTGLALVSNLAELHRAVRTCAALASCAALVEEYVEGRELELSVLEGWPSELPIIELKGLKGLNDQTAKSAPDHGLTRVPAEFDVEYTRELYRLARRASDALGVRDYVRFDIRVRQTASEKLEAVFLEANAKPSFEREFGLDRALKVSAKTVSDAIEYLIQRTASRVVSPTTAS